MLSLHIILFHLYQPEKIGKKNSHNHAMSYTNLLVVIASFSHNWFSGFWFNHQLSSIIYSCTTLECIMMMIC